MASCISNWKIGLADSRRCSVLLTIRKGLWRTLKLNLPVVKGLRMSNIEHFLGQEMPHYAGMKSKELTPKQILSVPCTTCGAGVGDVCELHAGDPRTEPHRDRKLSAADAVENETSRNTTVELPISQRTSST